MGWGPILLKNLTTSKNNQTIVYIIIYIHIFIFITIKFLTKPLRVLEDKVNKTNKQNKQTNISSLSVFFFRWWLWYINYSNPTVWKQSYLFAKTRSDFVKNFNLHCLCFPILPQFTHYSKYVWNDTNLYKGKFSN